MKKTIAMKWAKALESGKYSQTRGALMDNSGYCCLGVLTRLYAREKKIPLSRVVQVNNLTLPCRVLAWSGCEDDNPNLDGQYLMRASILNDVEKYSFKEIAKLIRKNWKTI